MTFGLLRSEFYVDLYCTEFIACANNIDEDIVKYCKQQDYFRCCTAKPIVCP